MCSCAVLWRISYVSWGWIDWLRKLHPINHIDSEYLCVVKSKHITPQQNWYVFLDYYFYEQSHESEEITDAERQNWHPKYDFQKESMFHIAESGPGTPKIDRSKCIQAQCFYSFSLKWGGCPANMDTFTNPCEQEKFPSPNNIIQPNEITNPAKSKESYLYSWDEQQGIITRPAAKRIKTYLSPTKSFTDYGAKDLPPKAQETESDQETTEEETETLQEQLLKLRKYRKQLKRRINRLT